MKVVITKAYEMSEHQAKKFMLSCGYEKFTEQELKAEIMQMSNEELKYWCEHDKDYDTEIKVEEVI